MTTSIATALADVPDRLITRPAAGALIGGTAGVVQRLIDSGAISGYRIGGRVMVRESHIREYVERCRIVPESP